MVRERMAVEGRKQGLNQQELEALDAAVKEYRVSGPTIDEFPDRPQLDREQDQAKVDELHKEYARRTTRDSIAGERLGTALELVIAELGTSWLPGVISKTSEYDDYKNHIDLVLELEDGNDRKLRIGIDVTASPESARKKTADIMEALYGGIMSKLKYFKSQLVENDDDEEQHRPGHEPQYEVPRIVIGTDDRRQLDELFGLFLAYQQNADPARRAMLRESITRHPLGREFTGQVLLQLTQSIKALSKSRATADRTAKLEQLQATLDGFQAARNKNPALARPSVSAQGRNGVFDVITKFWVTA